MTAGPAPLILLSLVVHAQVNMCCPLSVCVMFLEEKPQQVVINSHWTRANQQEEILKKEEEEANKNL